MDTSLFKEMSLDTVSNSTSQLSYEGLTKDESQIQESDTHSSIGKTNVCDLKSEKVKVTDQNEDTVKVTGKQTAKTGSDLNINLNDLEDSSQEFSHSSDLSPNGVKGQGLDQFGLNMQASARSSNHESHITNSVENEGGNDGEHDNYIYIKFKNGKEVNYEMATSKKNFPSMTEDKPEVSGSTPGTSNSRPRIHVPRTRTNGLLQSEHEFFTEYLSEFEEFVDDEDDGERNPWEMSLQQLYGTERDILEILGNQGIFDLDSLPSRLQELSEPVYPCNEKEKGTCDICVDANVDIRKRLCCNNPVCEPCITEYLKNEVEQRNIRMQCISCNSYVHRDEILALLPVDTKEKYYQFLTDENKDPNVKTCPRCSVAQNRNDIVSLHSPEPKKRHKKKIKGLKVTCSKCALVWCFDCHAPWHQNIKCKEYKKGDKLVKSWAKEFSYGQKNAVKCPKCKVFIQKKSGCSHMTCSNCNTSFCYRCGHRYLQMKLIGKHSDKFGPLGCKYNLLPDKPVARKAVRGGVLCAKILGGIGLGVLVLSAVAIFIGGSMIFVPAYFGGRYHQKRKRQKVLKSYRNSQAKLEEMRKARAGTAEFPKSVLKYDDSITSQLYNSDTMTSTESASSSEHESTEVKVWVHSEVDQKPVEVVQYKSQEQQTTSGNHDNNVTTAEVTMENDLVVLHVKTTNKSGEVGKQEVDGSVNQTEENTDDTEEMTKNDKVNIAVDTQGCFVKILGKLPVKWDKEEGKEVNVKDNVVTAKTAIVKEKKRKLASRRSKSVDIPDSDLVRSGISDGSEEVKISEIHNVLQMCDETDSYYGLVAMETCDTGF